MGETVGSTIGEGEGESEGSTRTGEGLGESGGGGGGDSTAAGRGAKVHRQAVSPTMSTAAIARWPYSPATPAGHITSGYTPQDNPVALPDSSRSTKRQRLTWHGCCIVILQNSVGAGAEQAGSAGRKCTWRGSVDTRQQQVQGSVQAAGSRLQRGRGWMVQAVSDKMLIMHAAIPASSCGPRGLTCGMPADSQLRCCPHASRADRATAFWAALLTSCLLLPPHPALPPEQTQWPQHARTCS